MIDGSGGMRLCDAIWMEFFPGEGDDGCQAFARMVPDFEDWRQEGGREGENWLFGRELDDWARAGGVRSRGSPGNSGKPHFVFCVGALSTSKTYQTAVVSESTNIFHVLFCPCFACCCCVV